MISSAMTSAFVTGVSSDLDRLSHVWGQSVVFQEARLAYTQYKNLHGPFVCMHALSYVDAIRSCCSTYPPSIHMTEHGDYMTANIWQFPFRAAACSLQKNKG